MRKIGIDAEARSIADLVHSEWVRHGLSSDATDRAATELGMRRAYSAAGLDPARMVIWARSPMAGAIAEAQLTASIGRHVTSEVWTDLRTNIDRDLETDLRTDLPELRASVEVPVREAVWDRVGALVDAEIVACIAGRSADVNWGPYANEVANNVWSQVWDTVGDQIWCQGWEQACAAADGLFETAITSWSDGLIEGQFGSHTMALDEAATLLGVPAAERSSGVATVASNSGYWWPHEFAVILTERPTMLARDEQGLLHNENGPAIQYSDGWGIWCRHGVRVDH